MGNLNYKNIFFIASLFTFLLPTASNAGVSIGYAQDVVHAAGTNAVVARYDHAATRLGGQAMYWDGPDGSNYSLGLDYDVLPSPVYDLNLGAVYIGNVRDINGTHLNFSIGAGVNLWERVHIQFSHFSNAHKRDNNGWNFIGIMLRL